MPSCQGCTRPFAECLTVAECVWNDTIEATVTSDEWFSLIYAAGVAFSERQGVSPFDAPILTLNGGSAHSVHSKVIEMIETQGRVSS